LEDPASAPDAYFCEKFGEVFHKLRAFSRRTKNQNLRQVLEVAADDALERRGISDPERFRQFIIQKIRSGKNGPRGDV